MNVRLDVTPLEGELTQGGPYPWGRGFHRAGGGVHAFGGITTTVP